jgi:hypothetical protein
MDETVMRIKTITTAVLLAASLFIAACVVNNNETSSIKSFDHRLQGTWESNDKTIYSGTLVIGYDQITITGFTPDQTPAKVGNDNERPFRQFYRGQALKGYSEDGNLYLVNGGITEVVPYIYSESNPPPSYNLVKKLQFTFGGRLENMDFK